MIKIRLIKKRDLKTLAKIYCEVYKRFNVGERWDKESAYNLLSYWFGKQPDLSFVAEYDGKIVGAFIAGIKPWWDGNHLFDGELFVHPAYQKLGIGTELSKMLYETAIKKYNVKSFEGFTFKTRSGFPLNWYKSQGFEEVINWVMISGSVKKALANLKRKLIFSF